MKAAMFSRAGGPAVLKFRENVPPPTPKRGEVLVQLRAAALNRLDIWVRKGLPGTQPFPHIPGSDGAGVVVHTAKGTRKWKEGDAVVLYPGLFCGKCPACQQGRENRCSNFRISGFQTQGTYADLIAVPEKNLFPKPDRLSFSEAAAFPLTFLTAYHMLFTLGRGAAGEHLLIPSVGSGVGAALLQLARWKKMTATVTASTEKKLKQSKRFGADHTLNTTQSAYRAFLKEKRECFDLIADHTGGDNLSRFLPLLKKGGRLVFCGMTCGSSTSLTLRDVYVPERQLLGAYLGTRQELKSICKLVEKRVVRPIVDKVFPLSKASDAHRYLDQRKHFGKVVLQINR